jgi:hypothetical protein
MKSVWHIVIVALFSSWHCIASQPRACVGSVPVGSFRLSLEPAQGGSPLPLRSVNVVRTGQKLKYEPLQLAHDIKEKAKIAVLLVPAFLEVHEALESVNEAINRLVLVPQGF